MKSLTESIFQAITEVDFNNCTDEDLLRIGVAAEEGATNLYNRLARAATNEDVKKVFKDIALEEKIHVGEFQAMLERIDTEETEALNKGYEEVEEMIKIKEEVQVGGIILEKGDKVKILKERVPAEVEKSVETFCNFLANMYDKKGKIGMLEAFNDYMDSAAMEFKFYDEQEYADAFTNIQLKFMKALR